MNKDFKMTNNTGDTLPNEIYAYRLKWTTEHGAYMEDMQWREKEPINDAIVNGYEEGSGHAKYIRADLAHPEPTGDRMTVCEVFCTCGRTIKVTDTQPIYNKKTVRDRMWALKEMDWHGHTTAQWISKHEETIRSALSQPDPVTDHVINIVAEAISLELKDCNLAEIDPLHLRYTAKAAIRASLTAPVPEVVTVDEFLHFMEWRHLTEKMKDAFIEVWTKKFPNGVRIVKNNDDL